MKNQLSSMCPDLALEWSSRNVPLSPDDVSYGSHLSVWWKGKCGHEWQAQVKTRALGRKSGCPYCSGNRVLPGFNDLATKAPYLVYEWSDRNAPLMPDMVTASSNRKVWWEGLCGHEWQSVIADRYQGHGCPYCNDHKLLIGFNDFATKHPDLAKEWSDRNLPLTPDQIPEQKNMIAWWTCSNCGCDYQAWIGSRIAGSKCPYCSNRSIQVGVNDLSTTDPQLANEWVFEKNKGATPQTITRTSRKSYWWRCSYGHEWKAKVYDRAIRHAACVQCYAEYLASLPELLVLLYARQRNMRVLFNSEETIGICLEMFIPDLCVAIESTSSSEREQTVKSYICSKNGIKYYVLPPCQDQSRIVSSIRAIFQDNYIFVRTPIENDIQTVKKQYEALRESKGRCTSIQSDIP